MDFRKFDLQDFKDCLIVTDGKLQELYNIVGDNVFVISRGESAKNFVTVQELCSWFLQKNLKRNQTVVAVGGGSVGDTVGFACSVFKRGVGLLHVPTTLLAMVDSCVGGKTAIDHDGIKNAVGSFYPADALIDPQFLNTLDNEQMLNGMGEILKYRMLTQQIDDVYAQNDLLAVIRACYHYKLAVCDIDPFDEGIRRKLNFGHTIGHAMELSLKIPHGVAVLYGIYYETLLAAKLGLCDQDYCQKWQTEVQKFVGEIPPLTSAMLQLTLQDKKNDNDLVAFILPHNFHEQTKLPLDKVKSLLLDEK